MFYVAFFETQLFRTTRTSENINEYELFMKNVMILGRFGIDVGPILGRFGVDFGQMFD